VFLSAVAFVVWVSTGYSASVEAKETLKKADLDNGDWYAFAPEYYAVPRTGVVIYPGGRVSADAYALVAQWLARESGALVAVTRTPP
jgi:hypothetical protein